ncbi:NAD(+) diphosphatase [Marinobacterium marinum]|uniref:NAD(+) diphosphatase n=1 Tax=Marinobacterium marinum TaxID=2756129 RepID=A0A7W1WXI9_9GAMM|nr:NAD(+) diphosphatase [Marinobacterium marinum]MBA4501983.1 NAD(+) diphosphatase [Marinobacterium marinum]
MEQPVHAGRFYFCHGGQLLWQGEQLEFARSEITVPMAAIECSLKVDDGYGLHVLRRCPEGMSADVSLRRALAQAADENEYARLARAAQLATWFDQHRFCGRCGATLEAHKQDLARVCSACELVQYPRVSPCIIVLVRRGNQCLLARSGRFPPGRFSTLAGFIEAGERAEAAVRREIREEVGIEVKNLEFFASQSWPFPHQLMLGFFADYAGGDLIPDGYEIQEAGWFDQDNLPDLPPPFSISRQLIDRFFATRAGVSG